MQRSRITCCYRSVRAWWGGPSFVRARVCVCACVRARLFARACVRVTNLDAGARLRSRHTHTLTRYARVLTHSPTHSRTHSHTYSQASLAAWSSPAVSLQLKKRNLWSWCKKVMNRTCYMVHTQSHAHPYPHTHTLALIRTPTRTHMPSLQRGDKPRMFIWVHTQSHSPTLTFTHTLTRTLTHTLMLVSARMCNVQNPSYTPF